MIMLTSRNHLSLRRMLLLTVFALTLAAPPPGVFAFTLLAPKGQKAILEYTIDIEGKASGTNNNYQSQQWSTRRSLVVRATLIAQQPSIQDPGDPGGPHRAASPPPEMAAFMAELEKCGEDMACRMRVTQKMAKKAGESLGKGSPRYQIWIADPKTPATGTVKMEVQRDQLFKTAVDERESCREAAELKLEELMRGVTWPATIKVDAQKRTYAADLGSPGNTFTAKIDCVRLEGRRRSEEHTKTGRKFLPEKYQKATPDEIEVFRGDMDAATGDRQLMYGKKVLTGVYGTLVGDVPMTAIVTVRWSLTLLKD